MAPVGEDSEFETWYASEHARLLASLVFIAGDLETAREAADEAFVRALVRWDQVKAMASPGGWTYRVALNVMNRRHRRAAIERRLLRRQREERVPEIPEPALELWGAVAGLPERQRVAVVLRYIGDLPESEIANAMGVARGTVASTLASARTALGQALDDQSQDAEQEVPHA
jgi:RNA polymerase sigma-70 factor (ECF subfamily)